MCDRWAFNFHRLGVHSLAHIMDWGNMVRSRFSPLPPLTFRKSWQLASSLNLCLTKHSWLAPLAHKKSRVESREPEVKNHELGRRR